LVFQGLWNIPERLAEKRERASLTMESLWTIRAEIEIESGDLNLEVGYTRGFMNVVTWANSDQSARDKLSGYLTTFDWRLLGVEESAAADLKNLTPDSEIKILIERAIGNPNAIILGTFHSYQEK
jgi:hypothetical protein